MQRNQGCGAVFEPHIHAARQGRWPVMEIVRVFGISQHTVWAWTADEYPPPVSMRRRAYLSQIDQAWGGVVTAKMLSTWAGVTHQAACSMLAQMQRDGQAEQLPLRLLTPSQFAVVRDVHPRIDTHPPRVCALTAQGRRLARAVLQAPSELVRPLRTAQRVLCYLLRGPSCAADVAAGLSVERYTAHRGLSQLGKRGQAEREGFVALPGYRMPQLVWSLTPDGRAEAKRLRALHRRGVAA